MNNNNNKESSIQTMKFLLAVGSKEFSEPTLSIGSQVAKAFNAELTIVYVGGKPKQLYQNRVSLAFDRLAQWEIHHPGINVLYWAFKYLLKCGYLETEKENGFKPENIVRGRNRYRMVLSGSYGRNINLILREGDVINELRQEALVGEYNLTIIGGSGKRRMAHNIVQYLPTSVFVVKNADLQIDYKLVILVDDSKGTKKAVKFGTAIAKSRGMKVNTLTVSKRPKFGRGYQGAAKSAARYLQSQGIEYEQHFLVGDPVETFINFTGDDHILVMGVSGQSALKKFFVGSKPIKTLEKANFPILIVK